MSNPTWGNHGKIFQFSGLNTKQYRYYNSNTIKAECDWILEDLDKAKEYDAVLLHSCAHNPTGCDLTEDEWNKVAEVISRKRLLPILDTAYQGFATGCLENDAYSIRLLSNKGLPVITTQSYAKNLGLYGQRVGCLSVVCESPEERARVESQIKIVIRAMYSSPPVHGARLASEVLNDNELFEMWKGELVTMSGRINDMRNKLFNELTNLNNSKDWSHIKKQIGMFAYTGLRPDQVQAITDKYHI